MRQILTSVCVRARPDPLNLRFYYDSHSIRMFTLDCGRIHEKCAQIARCASGENLNHKRAMRCNFGEIWG
jgi:hypothetical protein